MSNSFNLRPAMLSDKFEIAELCLFSWKNSFSEFIQKETLVSFSLENAIKSCEKSILPNEKKSRIILASINSEEEDPKKLTIGFINFGYSFCEGIQNPGEIFAVHVLNSYQKHGVGRLLVNAAIDTLFSEGCFYVISWVLDKNQASMKFFERMGGKNFSSGTRTIGDKDYLQKCLLWENHLLPNEKNPALLNKF